MCFARRLRQALRRVVYAASSSAYGDTPTLPKVETMRRGPNRPMRCRSWWVNITLACSIPALGWRRWRCGSSTSTARGRIRAAPYSGVLSLFMKHLLARTAAHHLRRRRTDPRLHLRRRRRRAVPEGGDADGVGGQDVQRRKRWALFAEPHLGSCCRKWKACSLPARHVEAREGDVRDSQADRTAAARDLGHAPRFTLEEGLQRTLAWYKTQ